MLFVSMHNRVTGLSFFQETTINTYLDMVQLYAVHQIQHLQLHIVLRLDGAPLRWGLPVRAYLDEKFPGRWISREGPLVLPPRSPDLTPLDCVMLDYVSIIVYQSSFTGIDDQKKRVTDTTMAIHADVHPRSWQDLEHLLDVVRATECALIAVY
jgi:hypothetical protein